MSADNLWERFITLCLYFLQGRDDLIPLLLRKKYGDKINKQKKKEETEEEILAGLMDNIFRYRSLIHFYNMRGEKLSESEVYKERYHNKKINDWKAILRDLYKDRRTYLEKINKILTKYINNERLWEESDQKGLSRNFLDCDPKAINVQKMLQTIVIYILRGYCSFYVGETLFVIDINWAKKSLADLLQALYLTKTWYNSYLSEENGECGLIFNFDRIWENPQNGSAEPLLKVCIEKICKGESNNKEYQAYVMWWLFILIDILRGNVYKKIFDTESAFDCYCNAMRIYKSGSRTFVEKAKKRFESIIGKKTKNLDDKFLWQLDNFHCKTLAKTCREKAKVFFEKGYFLESLKWYLKCLQHLLLMGLNKSDMECQKKAIELYLHIDRIVEQINCEKSMSVFKKSHIRRFFEDPKDMQKYFQSCKKKGFILPNKKKFTAKQTGPIRPEFFKGAISDNYKHIAADVFVRIGFLLHVLREHVLLPYVEGLAENLKEEYRKLQEFLFERNKKYILPWLKPEDHLGPNFKTSLGCYWQNIYDSDSRGISHPDDFSEEVEKLFASEAFKQFHKCKPKSGLQRMAREIGLILTQNIDELMTIPKKLQYFFLRGGYKTRVCELRGPNEVLDKLVVLRRWQSFNPKIPRPKKQKVSGGGYLLLWQGRGIAIDPGYGFIQNLYDEGFSVEDIDAILITHSHPDHDDELSTFLTMLHEWNRWHQKTLKKKEPQKVDLFLNEGTYRKYHTWLYSPTHVVSKIYQLQLNVWDIEGRRKCKRRGKNMYIDLRGKNGYSLAIEVIPAWHDEIIAKHSAIGIKIYLYKNNKATTPAFTIGLTGDTYAYKGIERNYHDCDILLAHLGDVKFREVRKLVGRHITRHIFDDYFTDGCSPQKANKILEFIARLDLADIKKLKGKDKKFLQNYLLLHKQKRSKREENRVKQILSKLFDQINAQGYKYKNHLGLSGLHSLHKAMCNNNNSNRKEVDRLFIVGELPEELASFRHMVTRWLNNMPYNKYDENHTDRKSYPKRKVRCFTGDIGLHIGLGIKRETPLSTKPIMIRCHRCMHNNELVKNKLNYHPVDKIQETIVKSEGARILYLCSTYNHAIEPLYKPDYFLSYLFSLFQ